MQAGASKCVARPGQAERGIEMQSGDIGRLKSAVNSVRGLERQLPYTVECECGEKIKTQMMEPVDCKTCGSHHTFRSEPS